MPEFEIPEDIRKKQRSTIARRSVGNLENRYAQQNRSDLEEAEQMMAPPVVNIPQCHVCQHPKRFWIERQLLKGVSYSSIAGAIEHDPTCDNVDRRSIANHSKTHMPLNQAIMRAELEEEADLVGQGWEEGVRGAITTRGMLRTMLHKGYDDAMAGITTVEPRDLIQMAKLYSDMDASASVAATEEAKTAVRIFMEAIKNVVAELFEGEQADELLKAIVLEVRRLRQRDEIEIEVERNMPAVPALDPSIG